MKHWSCADRALGQQSERAQSSARSAAAPYAPAAGVPRQPDGSACCARDLRMTSSSLLAHPEYVTCDD